jgi:hypothetical protein
MGFTRIIDRGGDTIMRERTALCSVVTAAVLEEFLLLKFSVDTFHERTYQWFVRSDRFSATILSNYSDISCTVFEESLMARPKSESQAFRSIVAEKMNAMEDAWNAGDCTSVAFLDADLIMTAAVLDESERYAIEVLLTPHYYPSANRNLERFYGHYNTGFAFSKTPRFHKWWRIAFAEQPDRFADQACMNEVKDHFAVQTLSERANIGVWRSSTFGNFRTFGQFNEIPSDCLFLHVHLFQPLNGPNLWIQKLFALHCLTFLRASAESKHRALFNEILARDRSGWYESTLRLS